MSLKSEPKNEHYGLFEKASIVIFVLIVALILLLNPSTGQGVVDQVGPGVKIEAYAIAMPNQGWAPMTVYFSAFGSESQVGDVMRYEWDLDANGLYDTDATAKGGYASYNYAKPGAYTVTLRVTDEQGNTATDSVLINVRHPASSSVDYWTVFDDSQVRRVDVALTTADWHNMWTDPEAKIEVPADVVVFGKRLDDVGFRMRGHGRGTRCASVGMASYSATSKNRCWNSRAKDVLYHVVAFTLLGNQPISASPCHSSSQCQSDTPR